METFQAVALAQSVTLAVLVSALHHKPAKVVVKRVLMVKRNRSLRDGIAIVVLEDRKRMILEARGLDYDILKMLKWKDWEAKNSRKIIAVLG